MTKLLLEEVGKKYVYSSRGTDFLTEDDSNTYSYLVTATDYSFRSTYTLKVNKWSKDEVVLETNIYSSSKENEEKLEEETKKIDKIIESLTKYKNELKKGANSFINHCKNREIKHTCGACYPNN